RPALRAVCRPQHSSVRRPNCGGERRGRVKKPSTASNCVEPSGAMIQLRSLEKFYEMGGGKFYVLRRITLDVAAGEFITIMGPSGAGKSTLLAILGMLDRDRKSVVEGERGKGS